MILSKIMNSETQKAFYCDDDGKYREYCSTCEKLCIERFYNNHLKSRTSITHKYYS